VRAWTVGHVDLTTLAAQLAVQDFAKNPVTANRPGPNTRTRSRTMTRQMRRAIRTGRASLGACYGRRPDSNCSGTQVPDWARRTPDRRSSADLPHQGWPGALDHQAAMTIQSSPRCTSGLAGNNTEPTATAAISGSSAYLHGLPSQASHRPEARRRLARSMPSKRC
jgi:hypothetical protein